jgi:hypothetical protein
VFFAFGNVAIDDLVFADGSTMWNVPGGAAVYAALGMAVWDERATTVAPFGPEYPSADLARIDFACTERLPQTMRNWGLYEDDGSRHFLPRRASEDWDVFSPQAGDLGPGPYPFCHLGPMPWARAGELITALRARGARIISADLHDRKLARVTLEQYVALAERIDVLLPSVQDVAVYLPGLDAVAALRALRARLPQVAVIGVKRPARPRSSASNRLPRTSSMKPAPATRSAAAFWPASRAGEMRAMVHYMDRSPRRTHLPRAVRANSSTRTAPGRTRASTRCARE